MFKDYYKILEVASEATPQEIKASYYTLSKKWHPDKNPNKDVTSIMQDINEAYAILKDPQKKKRYDIEYLIFFQKKKDHVVRNTERTTKQDEQHVWTYDYEVKDTDLHKDIKEAREYAKKIVEDLFRELADASKKATKGAWDGMKTYVFMMFLFTLIGLFVRTCSNISDSKDDSSLEPLCPNNSIICSPQDEIAAEEIDSLAVYRIPKSWDKYYVGNDVFSICIPPCVEYRKEYDPYTKELRKQKIYRTTSNSLIFQPKGLGQNKEVAQKKYCRVMIMFAQGEEGNFPKPTEILHLDIELKSFLKEIVDEQLGGFVLAEDPTYQWVNVQGANGIRIKYQRQGLNNNKTNCLIYLFFNNDKIVEIVISYRESEQKIWLPDLDNIIRTFKWE